MHRSTWLLLWVLGWLASTTLANPVESVPGGLRVTLEPSMMPIPLNQMHSWTVIVHTTDGSAATDAGIVVDGGMPAHDHGLATRPQVTRELGDGRYLLEGVRFHMAGEWLLRLDIRYRDQQYRADVSVTL